MRMEKRLTALAVESAKPTDGRRREIPDAGTGLYLVIQPSGAKSWAARYRFDGKPRKLTLGDVGTISLAAARKAVATARHEVEQGIDPAKTKRQAKEAEREEAAREAGDTIEWAVTQFLGKHVSKKRPVTASAYRRM